MALFFRKNKDTLEYFKRSSLELLDEYKARLKKRVKIASTLEEITVINGNTTVTPNKLGKLDHIRETRELIQNAKTKEEILSRLTQGQNNIDGLIQSTNDELLRTHRTGFDLNPHPPKISEIKLPKDSWANKLGKHAEKLHSTQKKHENALAKAMDKTIEQLTAYANLETNDSLRKERQGKLKERLGYLQHFKSDPAGFLATLKAIKGANDELTKRESVGKGSLSSMLEAQIKTLEKLVPPSAPTMKRKCSRRYSF